jgi:hypothetical protein
LDVKATVDRSHLFLLGCSSGLYHKSPEQESTDKEASEGGASGHAQGCHAPEEDVDGKEVDCGKSEKVSMTP